MEIYAKGQLSFLILNCLLERDFYGLDIITEIKTRSNGNIDLKKPSVYSNLTRMEKQGLVSSYMQSSELGPNRRYYSIRKHLRAPLLRYPLRNVSHARYSTLNHCSPQLPKQKSVSAVTH